MALRRAAPWQHRRPNYSLSIEPIDLGIPGLSNIEQIRTGGNAVVFRARQDELDRSVVVKVLMNVDAETTRRRFNRERKAMGRLSQTAGIAPVYGSGFTPSGQPYLLMPFYEKGSLQDRIRQTGAVPPDEVRDLGIAISKAVQSAHENGVLHRDLKPANILVRRSGQPDVADFGIAHLTDDQLGASQALTMTPLYTAPEVFDGVDAGAASDVYSVGATLYALANGHPAYSDPDASVPVISLLRRIKEDPLPPLPSRVPPGLATVIATAMSKNVADRYGSASELAAALQTVDMSAAAPQTSRTPQRRRGAAIAGVVALALILAASGLAGAFWLRDRTDDSPAEVVTDTPARPTPTPLALAEPGEIGPDETEDNEVQIAAEVIDLAAISAAAQDALVRVEAFSCGGVGVSNGLLLADGRILTSSEVLVSPWWVEIVDEGISFPARAEGVNVADHFGLVALGDGVGNVVGMATAEAQSGDVVAIVGVDREPVLASVGESRDNADQQNLALTLVDENDVLVATGDLVMTPQQELAGVVIVTGDGVEFAATNRLVAETGDAPVDDCETTERAESLGSAESMEAAGVRELVAMQQLSNAYAQEQWNLVRQLEPAKATVTDADFALGWLPLRQGYLFPLGRASDELEGSVWRLGLVGHETWDRNDFTTLFCVTWAIDPESGTVTQTGRDPVTIFGVRPQDEQLSGFRDPGTLGDEIREQCDGAGGAE